MNGDFIIVAISFWTYCECPYRACSPPPLLYNPGKPFWWRQLAVLCPFHPVFHQTVAMKSPLTLVYKCSVTAWTPLPWTGLKVETKADTKCHFSRSLILSIRFSEEQLLEVKPGSSSATFFAPVVLFAGKLSESFMFSAVVISSFWPVFHRGNKKFLCQFWMVVIDFFFFFASAMLAIFFIIR